LKIKGEKRKMYKIKKRALTLLVLITLLLSFMPIMPASAITIEDTWDPEEPYTPTDEGDKGDTIGVTGEDGDVPGGRVVELYWDDITKDWDGTEGKMNSTTADSDGSWEVWFDVPEAEGGEHTIYVVVPEQDDDWDSTPFNVVPKVKLSPTSGLEDERITADFTGFDGGKDIVILWVPDLAGVPDYDTLAVVGEVLDAVGDGAEEDWDDDLANDPIVPGTLDIYIEVLGVPTLAFSDVDMDGELAEQGLFTGSADINYANGDWELDNVEYNGAPILAGEDFTADYEYYQDGVGDQEILSTGVTTSLGSLLGRRLTVPEPMALGDYWVVGLDQEGYIGEDDFSIGATIEVSNDEVETGDVIRVEGRGFTPNGDIIDIELYKGAVFEADITALDEDDLEIDGDGEFDMEIVMPEASKKDDDFELHVTDDGAETANVDIEYLKLADFEVDPEFGASGSRISFSGSNFPKEKGEEVTLNLYTDAGAFVREIMDEIETDADGTISGTFRVPPAETGEYEIRAEADDHEIEDGHDFRIGRITVVIYDEDEGPAGKEFEITGSGFTEDGEWNATFGDMELEDSAQATGTVIEGFYYHVPQVEPGTYDIEVWDVDAEIPLIVEYTVTATTEATITPTEAPRKYNMTLDGMYWPYTDMSTADVEDFELEFLVWNETDDWDITGDVGTGLDPDDEPDVPAWSSNEVTHGVVDEDDAIDGKWTAWWKIDQSMELDQGTYWMNVSCEDQNDEEFVITLEFTIGPVHEEISPRKAVFRIGETVTFQIEHSYGDQPGEDIFDGYIDVYDPAGNLYWAGDPLDEWTDVDLWHVVPISGQTAGEEPMVLLDDAPLGEWSYEWVEVDDDVIATGTFTVQPSEADVLSGQIEDLAGDLDTLSDEISGVSDEIASVKSDIADAIAAANAATQAANAATEAVNSIAETANSAAEAAQDAATAAEEAKAASSGLTTLVYGAIGASLVAALAAIVSLMQISRRIAG
jgi:hypothetical protein